MPTRRFRRIALASQLLVVGCSVVFGACVLIKHAQAQQQFVPPAPPVVPPPPPPVLNPIPPNTTVPQPSYKPISPTTPSTAGSEVTSPVNEEPQSTTARSHRTSVTKTRSIYHRYRPTHPVLSYYPLPFGGYGCVWQRAWDGYWYRTSPCSW